MVRALVSRSYLDLNREPFELDARMFDAALPDRPSDDPESIPLPPNARLRMRSEPPFA